MPTVVLKIGGSLFDLPDLGSRLSRLVGSFPQHRFLLFPGGGEAADIVRHWQPRFEWTDAVSHDMAIAALDFNAAMLAQVVPRGCVVHDRKDAEVAWLNHNLPVLAPMRLLSLEDQDHFAVLPNTWETTSDSLAAWAALGWPADELWLCKSVPCPTGSLTDAITAGIVDSCLARIADQLPHVRWCDLRSGPSVVDWDITKSPRPERERRE